MLPITYILPLKAEAPTRELDPYLRRIAPHVEVVVVDGSPPAPFAANETRWRPLGIVHVGVDPDLETPMGKVGGVLTGVRLAGHDTLVIADDDVRWTVEQLREAADRLEGCAVVRPQNRFRTTRWHTRWDTGRTLVARAAGGDWPGTMVVDRRALVATGGYDGSALFENLELVRTLHAAGGRERLALDLVVDREPPTTGHFWNQRVRQAYDEWARPGRLLVELSLLPLAVAGGRRAVIGLALGAVGLAEVGRRRGGGRRAFSRTAALWAPCWVAERAVTSWLAAGTRLLGGARYGSGRLRVAANRPSVLQARVAAAEPLRVRAPVQALSA